MCVLTYIPTSENGFFLTSNRDEATERALALAPDYYEINGCKLIYPKDPQGGGTWIAGSENVGICLLNGGLEKHIHKPPYRQSRGLVILDFFKFKNFKSFEECYDFSNIEPFTLVVFDKKHSLQIREIRWTGSEVVSIEIDSQKANIWSSVTLYSQEIIEKRSNWFQDFLHLNSDPSGGQIIDFHYHGGSVDIENAIKMNRNEKLKTISITQFYFQDSTISVNYHDLQSGKVHNKFLNPEASLIR